MIAKRSYGWQFVMVALVIWAVFMLYPVVYSLVLSTKSCKGIVCEFSGLGNIKRVLQDKVFWIAFKNTLIIFAFQVPIMLTLALVLAAMLNDNKLKGRAFFRLALFLPCVTSLVAYAVIFKMLFANSGVVNNVLLWAGFAKEPIPWLTDPFWSKALLIIAVTWRWTGYNMIFYLAALQNIPSEVYEASNIDGATRIQQFFSITIPLLKPIIVFTAIMSTIGTLQLFDEPMNLTDGLNNTATLTLSLYIYKQSFVFVPNFGYAATMSYVIVGVVALLSIIQFKAAGKDA